MPGTEGFETMGVRFGGLGSARSSVIPASLASPTDEENSRRVEEARALFADEDGDLKPEAPDRARPAQKGRARSRTQAR
jgi:hypothetical protein